MSEVNGALAAFGPVIGEDGVFGAGLDGFLADNFHFGGSVGGELVDGDDDGHAVGLGVGDVLGKVDAAGTEDLDVFLLVDGAEGSTGGDGGPAAVDLKGADGGDDDDDVGDEAGGAALDVEEALAAHGEVEAGFGDDKTGLGGVVLVGLGTRELEGHLVGEDGAVADGDVGEGAGVDEYGCAFQTLHQVGLNGVLHEGGKSTTGTEVVGRDGVAASGAGNDHSAETLAHVGEVSAESENGHALTGDRNVEAGLAAMTLLGGSSADSDAAEMSVVDVQDASPGDSLWVDIKAGELADFLLGKIIRVGLVNAELLQAAEHDRRELSLAVLDRDQSSVEGGILLSALVEHAGINSSGEEVVSSGDGVDITSQMHVELVHGNDLTVTTAGSTALDAERWALTWLTNVGKSKTTNMGAQGLSKTHGGGRLALTERGGGDTGNNNVATISAMIQALEKSKVDLGLVGTIWLELRV